ncbi:Hypothetical predicted protein [Olea europaea subsp. europaea]|uniref:Uncharacterized protein n=1 Tax=Olea europaea subsp. europaea TaxID=158383 RepID=A0A8S0Q1Q6_OLEEU|nr:Hypothetical predicted protein [Olea europaea subsp. europaea]
MDHQNPPSGTMAVGLTYHLEALTSLFATHPSFGHNTNRCGRKFKPKWVAESTKNGRNLHFLMFQTAHFGLDFRSHRLVLWPELGWVANREARASRWYIGPAIKVPEGGFWWSISGDSKVV